MQKTWRTDRCPGCNKPGLAKDGPAEGRAGDLMECANNACRVLGFLGRAVATVPDEPAPEPVAAEAETE